MDKGDQTKSGQMNSLHLLHPSVCLFCWFRCLLLLLDFFDASAAGNSDGGAEPMEVGEEGAGVGALPGSLPEGFFDDARADAKVV